MAGVIDDREDEIDSVDDVDLEESEVVDNDEGVDLEGDQDEEIDAGNEDEELIEEDFEDPIESEEADVLEEVEEVEEEPEEQNGEDEESDQEEVQVSEKDAKMAELERQNETEKLMRTRLEQQVKDTLELLGIKVDGDVTEALDRVAAESEGKTLEEYRREKDEKLEIENARKALARQKFEQLAANDLAELKKSFPDLLSADNIRKCFNTTEDFIQFGKLRDSGVAPKTAYMAVNAERINAMQTKAAQQKVVSNGKGHITPIAPKKASDNSVVMSKEALLEWRDTFPDLTDAEIRKLYKESL